MTDMHPVKDGAVAIVLYDLTFLYALNLGDPAQAARVWDQVHAVATLQGIINRDAPRLYLRYVECDGRNVDDYWLEQMSKSGGWLAGTRRENVDTLERLVERFRGDIAGAVVYDGSLAALSNLASAFAGAEDLIAIRLDETAGSVYDRLVKNGPKLPVKRLLTREVIQGANTGSAKCDAYRWGIRELIETGRCDPRFLGYYIDAYWIRHAAQSVPNHHTLTNHDFFVAKRAFFCDLDGWGDEHPIDDPHQPQGADLQTFVAVLRALHEKRTTTWRLNAAEGELLHVGGFTPWAFKYSDHEGAGGKHFGVHSEWELTRIISAFGGFLDADAIGYGSMANASFFMHFPLQERYSQHRPPTDATPDDVDRVMFYVGDYDSAAWVYQRMPELWNDPERGRVPLNWAISPVLCRRAGMVLDWMWRTRTNNDHFIAADNGAGYANPSVMVDPPGEFRTQPCLDAWAAHCAAYYKRWDLRITGFVIDGLAPPSDERVLRAYARFSPDGVVCQRLETAAVLIDDLPVLRAGPDVNHDEIVAAAEQILADLSERRRDGLRFHWYRSVLKSPSWYARLVDALKSKDPRIRIVGAPEFFSEQRRSLRESGE